MTDRERSLLDGLSAVLSALGHQSTPQTRFVRHILFADIHDCWRYASRNPASITEGSPPEPQE